MTIAAGKSAGSDDKIFVSASIPWAEAASATTSKAGEVRGAFFPGLGLAEFNISIESPIYIRKKYC
jgi:hypothetical protein